MLLWDWIKIDRLCAFVAATSFATESPTRVKSEPDVSPLQFSAPQATVYRVVKEAGHEILDIYSDLESEDEGGSVGTAGVLLLSEVVSTNAM